VTCIPFSRQIYPPKHVSKLLLLHLKLWIKQTILKCPIEFVMSRVECINKLSWFRIVHYSGEKMCKWPDSTICQLRVLVRQIFLTLIWRQYETVIAYSSMLNSQCFTTLRFKEEIHQSIYRYYITPFRVIIVQVQITCQCKKLKEEMYRRKKIIQKCICKKVDSVKDPIIQLNILLFYIISLILKMKIKIIINQYCKFKKA
jgi:hypothetical protein